MTTSEPTGRALAEAAARAMGWNQDEEFGTWSDTSGEIRGDADSSWEWVPELLDWLHEVGSLTILSESDDCHAILIHYEANARDDAFGPTLRDALMRLVVAVAEREAKA